jgi:hypothetical protein
VDYINDININEAVIHVLDSNGEAPIINEYSLDLNEDVYIFLYKHIEKCLKDEDLKYAKFNSERNIVKEVVKDYLVGRDNNLIDLSKELAKQLFIIMESNVNIPSADLILASIVTDQGPMIAILKMDYVKNFTHEVQFIEQKIGVGIIPQSAGLPGSGQKIQKAAFIKPIRKEDNYNLMILDKQKSSKEDEYGSNYFMNTFLGATYVANERDETKEFIRQTEQFVRRALTEDAALAEKVRSTIKNKLEENDVINLEELSDELFSQDNDLKESFKTDLQMKAIRNEIPIDKTYVDKKLKRVRLNIDREIDLYINKDAYKDKSKFQIKRNGDGSIDMILKNIVNYIEK